jgi:hypothetical protein
MKAIAKLGFWSKVKVDQSFPALLDFPPDLFFIAGHIPQAY